MPVLSQAFIVLSLSSALAAPLHPDAAPAVVITRDKTLVCSNFVFVSEEAGAAYEESGAGQCAGSCIGRCSDTNTKEVHRSPIFVRLGVPFCTLA